MNQKLILGLILTCTSTLLFAHTNGVECDHFRTTISTGGIGFGSALAICISWTKNKSVRWAILQGLLSWVYVIYYILTRKESTI